MNEKLKQQENEALEKCYNVKHGGVYCYSEDAMRNMFEKGIDEAQRWIPLEEEKPPYYKPILVKYKSTNWAREDVACCWLAVDDNGFHCWTVNNTDHVLISKSVIAWRPINIE